MEHIEAQMYISKIGAPLGAVGHIRKQIYISKSEAYWKLWRMSTRYNWTQIIRSSFYHSFCEYKLVLRFGIISHARAEKNLQMSKI